MPKDIKMSLKSCFCNQMVPTVHRTLDPLVETMVSEGGAGVTCFHLAVPSQQVSGFAYSIHAGENCR